MLHSGLDSPEILDLHPGLDGNAVAAAAVGQVSSHSDGKWIAVIADIDVAAPEHVVVVVVVVVAVAAAADDCNAFVAAGAVAFVAAGAVAIGAAGAVAIGAVAFAAGAALGVVDVVVFDSVAADTVIVAGVQ